MDINKILLKKFNKQEIKYYDEGIIESKIITLEVLLKNSKNKTEINKIYKELKKNIKILQEMQNLRLINFIIETFN